MNEAIKAGSSEKSILTNDGISIGIAKSKYIKPNEIAEKIATKVK